MPNAAQKKQQPHDPHQAKKDAAKKEDKKDTAKKKEDREEHEKKREHGKELAKKKEATKVLARKKEARKPGSETDGESIALLHAAHQKLHEADHDYGGHRIEALRQVGAALSHLGSSASGDSRSGSGNMPQQRSDAILREARTKLEAIRNRLAAGAARSTHHGEARGALERAIHEVDLALNVR